MNFARVFALGLAVSVVASIPAWHHAPISLAESSQAKPTPPGFGLTIPWAVGGPRIELDGSRSQHPGMWPSFRVDAIRLWDTRTAWLNLEPRKGSFDFGHLDAHLDAAQAHGVSHVTLVLWGTPRWAAKSFRSTDPPWLGPGSASPPRSLGDWENFVTAVAERYRGRIHAYEIGNEVNTPAGFSGTLEEWAQMARAATRVIHAIDPRATLLLGGFAASNARQIKAIDPWVRILQKDPGPPAAPYDISAHIYVSTRDPRPGSTLGRTVNSLRGAFGHSVWVTEMNLLSGGNIDRQAIITRLQDLARCPGAVTCYFYAWNDLPSGRLVNLTAYPHAIARALARSPAKN